ncbi:YdhK family protein [Brevibacterium sp.]|uniref:YdhK family protein n=1 Tax=Brevibacterium sp. TaxID=1701 RepID=UPI003462C7AC
MLRPSQPVKSKQRHEEIHSESAPGEEHDDSHEHAADGGQPPKGIDKASDPTSAVGDEVTLTADHMPGMKGTEATIDSSTDDTVYMVDLDMGDMTMTNHKWVVEDEVQPAK